MFPLSYWLLWSPVYSLCSRRVFLHYRHIVFILCLLYCIYQQAPAALVASSTISRAHTSAMRRANRKYKRRQRLCRLMTFTRVSGLRQLVYCAWVRTRRCLRFRVVAPLRSVGLACQLVLRDAIYRMHIRVLGCLIQHRNCITWACSSRAHQTLSPIFVVYWLAFAMSSIVADLVCQGFSHLRHVVCSMLSLLFSETSVLIIGM